MGTNTNLLTIPHSLHWAWSRRSWQKVSMEKLPNAATRESRSQRRRQGRQCRRTPPSANTPERSRSSQAVWVMRQILLYRVSSRLVGAFVSIRWQHLCRGSSSGRESYHVSIWRCPQCFQLSPLPRVKCAKCDIQLTHVIFNNSVTHASI